MATRDVEARLRVTKDGDFDAFGKLASDVREVGDAGSSATTGLNKLDRSIDQVGDEAAEASKKLRDMQREAKSASGDSGLGGIGGAAQKAGKGLEFAGKAIGAAGAALLAFKESYNQTREVIGFLSKEFGIDIDAMVTKALRLQEIADIFTGVRNSIEQDSELLRNQQNIFDNLNIDGFTDNVAKNQELISEHMRAIADASDEAAEAVQKGQDFLSKIGLNQEELLEKARVFAEGFEEAMKLDGVDLEAVADRVGGQLERLMEDLRASGAEIPPNLQAISDQLSQFAEESSKASDKVEKDVPRVKTALDQLKEAADSANGISLQAVMDEFGHLNEVDLTRILEGLLGISSGEFQSGLDATANSLRGVGEAAGVLAGQSARAAMALHSINQAGTDAFDPDMTGLIVNLNPDNNPGAVSEISTAQ